jgi:hypothetical protein
MVAGRGAGTDCAVKWHLVVGASFVQRAEEVRVRQWTRNRNLVGTWLHLPLDSNRLPKRCGSWLGCSAVASPS